MLAWVVIFRRHSIHSRLGDGPHHSLPLSSTLLFHPPPSFPSSPIFRIFFQVPYPASPLFATLTKTAGVCTNNSQNEKLSITPERNSHESRNRLPHQSLDLRSSPLSAAHP